MLEISCDKIPRPDRSGLLSVIVCYLAFYGYFSALLPHGPGKFNLRCYVAPWDCYYYQEREYPPPQEEKIIPLYFSGGKSAPENCGCRYVGNIDGRQVEGKAFDCRLTSDFPRFLHHAY